MFAGINFHNAMQLAVAITLPTNLDREIKQAANDVANPPPSHARSQKRHR